MIVNKSFLQDNINKGIKLFEENKLIEWKTITKDDANENFEERSIIESTKKPEK